MVETDEWKAELERNGWESEYNNSKDFTTYLDEQDNDLLND